MLSTIRRLLGRLLSQWVAFWRRIEGPELEPPIWHSHFLSHHVTKSNLTELGHELNGLVIDIGAGTGHGARYLDPESTEYFPTDLPDGRDAADLRISQQSTAPVFHCSVYDLPFPEAHFGGAMMLSVLEHLEHPGKGLAEIYRVLKPGAYFLVSTPFVFPVHGAPWDFRRWTLAGLGLELQGAGFEIVREETCGGGAAALAMSFHLLLRYHFLRGSGIGKKLLALLLAVSSPVVLIEQALINGLACLLDRHDRTCAFPLVVTVLARKPVDSRGL
jgi:SAM-dependent methyltransferase